MRSIADNPTAKSALPWRGLIIVAGLALLIIAALLVWLAWQFTQLSPSVAGALRAPLFALLYGIPAGAAAAGLFGAYNPGGRPAPPRAGKGVALTGGRGQPSPLPPPPPG